MLLVFFFLALPGIYFSLLVSKQHDIVNGEKNRVSYGCKEIFTGSRQECVPERGRLHLSKICLGSAFLAKNSYLLLISPKYD